MGKILGKAIGEVIECEVDSDGLGWGPFLRIKVWVDITKPLIQGSLISNQGNPLWIAFKYKRLPNFYFKCGVIKHSILGCNKSPLSNKMHNMDQTQYGIWLRAPLTKTGRKGSNISLDKRSYSGSSSF